MDPKVLADALVEAGMVIEYATGGHYGLRNTRWMLPDELINDWRVAGKVLESMDASVTRSGSGFACAGGGGWSYGETLPRAIIEAWYASQEGEGESDEQGEDND